MQKAVAERWEKLTGHYLLEGYGLTECSPLVSVNPYDINCHTGSIGLPVPQRMSLFWMKTVMKSPLVSPANYAFVGRR